MEKNRFITIKTTEKAYSMLKDVAFLHNMKQYEVLEKLLNDELTAYYKQHIESEEILYQRLLKEGSIPVGGSRNAEDMLNELCRLGMLNEKAKNEIVESFKRAIQ